MSPESAGRGSPLEPAIVQVLFAEGAEATATATATATAIAIEGIGSIDPCRLDRLVWPGVAPGRPEHPLRTGWLPG